MPGFDSALHGEVTVSTAEVSVLQGCGITSMGEWCPLIWHSKVVHLQGLNVQWTMTPDIWSLKIRPSCHKTSGNNHSVTAHHRRMEIIIFRAVWNSYYSLLHDCGEEHFRRDLSSTDLQKIQVCIHHGVTEITLDVCHGLPLDLQAITHPHPTEDFVECNLQHKLWHCYHIQTLHGHKRTQYAVPEFAVSLWFNFDTNEVYTQHPSSSKPEHKTFIMENNTTCILLHTVTAEQLQHFIH